MVRRRGLGCDDDDGGGGDDDDGGDGDDDDDGGDGDDESAHCVIEHTGSHVMQLNFCHTVCCRRAETLLNPKPGNKIPEATELQTLHLRPTLHLRWPPFVTPPRRCMSES